MHELSDRFARLFEQGGPLLWAILALSTLMWILIIERYWFLRRQAPALRRELVAAWQTNRQVTAELRSRMLRSFTDRMRGEVSRHLLTIRTLTAILPMLGLLGTVTGMITVFQVITVFGTGNTRGMAAGISEALVTTLAGLATALPGLYLASRLEQRARSVTERLSQELTAE